MSDPTRSTLKLLPLGVLAVAVLLGAALLLTPGDPPLPVISQVRPFHLTNHLGRVSTLEDLRNKVWVGNIIFTRCGGPCLEMSRRMERLQKDLAGRGAVSFVTLTTDPEFDTPEVLKRYSERFKDRSDRWMFLTGAKAEIARLAVEDLKLTTVETEPDKRTSPEDLFIHSTISVVVDARGRLRGAVEVLEETGIDDLKRLIDRVLSE